MTVITQDNAPVFHTRRKSAVPSVTPVQITTESIKLSRGVTVFADQGNSERLWVGSHSSIDNGGSDANSGYPIYPGGEVFIAVDDISKVWCLADSAGAGLKILYVIAE